MKVLILAEEANPEWVSVPLIGWNYSQALAKITESLLVTQIRNREALIKKGLIEGTDFIAINSEPLAKPLFSLSDLITGTGKGWTTRMAFSYIYYPVFERLIWKKLGETN